MQEQRPFDRGGLLEKKSGSPPSYQGIRKPEWRESKLGNTLKPGVKLGGGAQRKKGRWVKISHKGWVLSVCKRKGNVRSRKLRWQLGGGGVGEHGEETGVPKRKKGYWEENHRRTSPRNSACQKLRTTRFGSFQ